MSRSARSFEDEPTRTDSISRGKAERDAPLTAGSLTGSEVGVADRVDGAEDRVLLPLSLSVSYIAIAAIPDALGGRGPTAVLAETALGRLGGGDLGGDEILKVDGSPRASAEGFVSSSCPCSPDGASVGAEGTGTDESLNLLDLRRDPSSG